MSWSMLLDHDELRRGLDREGPSAAELRASMREYKLCTGGLSPVTPRCGPWKRVGPDTPSPVAKGWPITAIESG